MRIRAIALLAYLIDFEKDLCAGDEGIEREMEGTGEEAGGENEELVILDPNHVRPPSPPSPSPLDHGCMFSQCNSL